MTRAALKSAAERCTTRGTIVILDSMNYIKGYRYELFCVSRAHSSSRCTVRPLGVAFDLWYVVSSLSTHRLPCVAGLAAACAGFCGHTA